MIHQCHRRTEGELKSDDTGGKPVRQVNAAEKRTTSELENVWILFFSRTGSWITPKALLRVTGETSGAKRLLCRRIEGERKQNESNLDF